MLARLRTPRPSSGLLRSRIGRRSTKSCGGVCRGRGRGWHIHTHVSGRGKGGAAAGGRRDDQDRHTNPHNPVHGRDTEHKQTSSWGGRQRGTTAQERTVDGMEGHELCKLASMRDVSLDRSHSTPWKFAHRILTGKPGACHLCIHYKPRLSYKRLPACPPPPSHSPRSGGASPRRSRLWVANPSP